MSTLKPFDLPKSPQNEALLGSLAPPPLGLQALPLLGSLAPPLLGSQVLPAFYIHDAAVAVRSRPKTKLPKATYEAVKAPKGTPLSRLIIKQVHGLSSSPIDVESDGERASHSVRIPTFPKRSSLIQRTMVVEEPLPCPTERGLTSPLAVRPRKKALFSFQRLAPGLTKSENFIPSTVLGNVEQYAHSKNLTRQVRALLRSREEPPARENHRLPSPDKSANCLRHFDVRMAERQALAQRLAQRMGRRVSQLVLNSSEEVRHKRELQDLGEMNQGPRPLYEIYVLDKKAPMDPERVFQEPPYKALTFTGKPGLMKLKTAVAGFEVSPNKKIKMKEFLMLNKNLKALHQNCQVGKALKQAPPDGLRDPDFNELMVIGTNEADKARISPLDRDNCLDSLKYFNDTDLVSEFSDTPGRNPFDPIREFPNDWLKPETIDPGSYPVLDVIAGNHDDVTITRRENGLDIFIKLQCGVNRPPATTALLLTNVGIEPLEFGLYPAEIEGTFAESFRLWTLPNRTKPRDIRVVVEGRSEPPSYLIFPNESFLPEMLDEQRFLPSIREQMESHTRHALNRMVSVKRPCGRVSVEEKFHTLNGLQFQSEGVTKLHYAWMFAYLNYSEIPWYDTLIDRERQKKIQLPGSINKRLLQDLGTVQVRLNHIETDKPEFVDCEVPAEAEGVYWRNPAIVYKCPVHDQDLPLPGTTAHFANHIDDIAPDSDEPSYPSSCKKTTPTGNKLLDVNASCLDRPVSRVAQDNSPSPKDPKDTSLPFLGKTKRVKVTTEIDTDWIPMVVINDELMASSAVQSGAATKKLKKKKYELNPELSQPEQSVPGATDADKEANKFALNEKWMKHALDNDWIATAVIFANQLIEPSCPVAMEQKSPEWNYSIGDLREAIQRSHHNIHIKQGLLREISKVEQAMAHVKPSVPINYTPIEEKNELLKGSMEFVLKRASTYTSDLLTYFQRVCRDTKPEEPALSVDLIKAREKMKLLEEAISPTGKVAASKAKKVTKPANEVHTEEEKMKSRPASKDESQQKMSETRPSKSAAVNASKSALGAKKGGVGGSYVDASRAEKDAKLHLAFLEAEHDLALERHKVKLAEFERWRAERESELEPKIAAFVNGLWASELKSLDRNVHERVVELQVERDDEDESIRKQFLDERRENTLRKLFDSFLLRSSEMPLAVAAWRARLTDNIVKQDNLLSDRVKEDWELRRKEVKIYLKERPNDRCTLQIRNIWRAPYTYQTTALHNDLIPLRSNAIPPPIKTEEAAVIQAAVTLSPKKDQDLGEPKSAGARRVSAGAQRGSLKSARGRTTAGPSTDHPLSSRYHPEPECFKPARKIEKMTKDESGTLKVLEDFNDCLNDITEEDKNAVEVVYDSGDEWETDDERVIDAWLYEPAGPEAIQKLPADFKFVSFKEHVKPTVVAPHAGVAGTTTAAATAEKVKKPQRKVVDEAAGQEEPNSSSDEE
ncbi:hypothetical protein BV898_11716 [Hypsibius exemplaris]|uniref:Uncharacterized protein n=1 Tax=Hypsibius exemplaris TaxID=2072580 RepID=A0A1W0WFS6_HYPEX|nr:hypothetical protein BV898_11716 [Hypsibius exemplaris]